MDTWMYGRCIAPTQSTTRQRKCRTYFISRNKVTEKLLKYCNCKPTCCKQMPCD